MGKKWYEQKKKIGCGNYYVTSYSYLALWTFIHQDTEESSTDSMGSLTRQNLNYMLQVIKTVTALHIRGRRWANDIVVRQFYPKKFIQIPMVVFVQFSALKETPLFFQVILYIFSNPDTFRIWQTLLLCGSSYSMCSKINVLGYKRFSMCCVPCSGWAHCSPGIAGYCRLGVQYKTLSDGILLS